MRAAAISIARGRPPIARFALRDLRGGVAGLRIFCLCIALGVAAIVGVDSLAKALNDGLGQQGRVILGGDASFSLIHRRLSPDEQAFLQRYGSLSTIATMRGMIRTGSGDAALAEIKAVEPSWPRIGAAVLDPPMMPAEALAQKDGDLRRSGGGNFARPGQPEDRRRLSARAGAVRSQRRP